MRIASAGRAVIVNAYVDQFDSTTFTLEIRTGSAPATVDAADSGTVLATFTGPVAPAFGAAVEGGTSAVATSGAVATVNASATGTAGHYRLKRGATLYGDGSVGTSGTEVIINDTAIVSGQPVSISSFTITLPGT